MRVCLFRHSPLLHCSGCIAAAGLAMGVTNCTSSHWKQFSTKSFWIKFWISGRRCSNSAWWMLYGRSRILMAELVHGLAAVGSPLQRERQVEDLAGVDCHV